MRDQLIRYLAAVMLLAVIAVAAVLTYLGTVNPKKLPPFAIRAVESPDDHLFNELGLDPVEFEINVPEPVRITLWVETYIHGAMVPEASFGRAWSIGRAYSGRVGIIRYRPVGEDASEPGRVGWTLLLDGDGAEMSSAKRWTEDYFHDSQGFRSQGAEPLPDRLDWGVTYRLYTRFLQEPGRSSITFHDNEADAIADTDRITLYKLRIDPLPASFGTGTRAEGFDPASP